MDLDKSIINIDNEDDIYIIDEENKNSLGEETFRGEETFKANEDNINYQEENILISQKKVSKKEDNNNIQFPGQIFGVFTSLVATILIIGTSLGFIPSLISTKVSNFILRSTELGFEVNKDFDKLYLMSLYNDDYKEEIELSDKNEYVFTNLNPSTVYNLELYDITDGINKKLYSANYLTMDKDNNSANIINSKIENKQLFLNVKYEGEGIDFVTVDIIENGKSILLYEGLPKDEFIIDLNDESSDIKCKIFINGKVAHFSQFVNEIEPENEPEKDPGGNEPGKEEDPGQEPETTIPVESISVDKSTLNLKVGEDYTLTATILPDDATDKTIIWESSNETVATVEDGKVTGVTEGSATITVMTPDGTISKTCNVTVEANVIPVESISVDKSTLNLKVGEEYTLITRILPIDATDKSVEWRSFDETIAIVVDGKVTAVSVGSTTIVVETPDGEVYAGCNVTVEAGAIPVDSIQLSRDSLNLRIQEVFTFSAYVYPDDATDKTVVWESSDETIATVVDGKITAIAEGSATITAMTPDGTISASCAVTVIQPSFSNLFVARNITNSGSKIVTFNLGYEDPGKVWNETFIVKFERSSYDSNDILFQGELKPATDYYSAFSGYSGRFMLTTWEASYLDTLENTNITYYITVYAPNTETLTSENSLFKRTFYGGQSFTNGLQPVPGSIVLGGNVENDQTGDVNPTFYVPSISGYDSIDVRFTNMLTNENVEIKNVTLGETTTAEIALPSGSADFEVIVFGHKADSTVVIVSEIITISN